GERLARSAGHPGDERGPCPQGPFFASRDRRREPPITMTSELRIAVDAMGGDHAPRAAVEGACLAAVEDGASVLLVGDEKRVRAELDRLNRPCPRIEIVHADEVVEMDDPPITPIRKKRRSSMRICAQLVKEGRAQAMVTAGNTGAAMITAKMVIGAIDGVD